MKSKFLLQVRCKRKNGVCLIILFGTFLKIENMCQGKVNQVVATAAIIIIPIIMRRKGPAHAERSQQFVRIEKITVVAYHMQNRECMWRHRFYHKPPAAADCAGLRPPLFSGGARRDARLIFVSSRLGSRWWLLLLSLTLEKLLAIINSSPQILLCKISSVSWTG